MSYCQKYGLLGPRTVLAHMVHLDDDDIEILSKTEASIAHCPTSNAKLDLVFAVSRNALKLALPLVLAAMVAPATTLWTCSRR